MQKCQLVPFKSMGGRQRLGLSLVLLPMEHLSMQIIELYFIIVQQAKSACNIRNKLFQQTSNAQTTNLKPVPFMFAVLPPFSNWKNETMVM